MLALVVVARAQEKEGCPKCHGTSKDHMQSEDEQLEGREWCSFLIVCLLAKAMITFLV